MRPTYILQLGFAQNAVLAEHFTRWMVLISLTPAMTKELVESMFGPKQKATMEATGEVDFAYTDTRVGRFRVNAFHQRGSYAAVLRIVASDIPTPEDLGVPEAVLGLTKKKRGLVLVTGTDRKR